MAHSQPIFPYTVGEGTLASGIACSSTMEARPLEARCPPQEPNAAFSADFPAAPGWMQAPHHVLHPPVAALSGGCLRLPPHELSLPSLWGRVWEKHLH